MSREPVTLTGHTCPGLCGRHLALTPFACQACERRLPSELRARIAITRWASDWPANSAAMTEGMHYLTTLAAVRAWVTDTVHGHRVDRQGGDVS